jgi:hypothetical protein
MPENLGKDLALSEPFMQLGNVLAQIGQQVQSGNAPQKVLDAFEYLKSHLASGGKQVEDAYETMKRHVGDAISPSLQAAPAQQSAPIHIPASELPTIHISADELAQGARPMNTAKVNGQDVPVDDWRQAVGKGQVIFSNRVLSGAAENAPAIGGAIGGTVGTALGGPMLGVPLAAAGGAAGSLIKAGVQRPDEAMAHPLQTAGYAAGAGVAQGAMEGIGAAVPAALTAGAKAVYRSYLKPSLAAKLAPKAEEIVNTALREALPITKAGATKAQQIIAGLNQQVQDVLEASGGKVDLHDVADRLRMWATKTFYKPGAATADLESAMKVADSIDQHASQEVVKQVPVTKTVQSAIVDESGKPFTSQVTTTKPVTTYRSTVPVGEAQETKQALQSSARNAYGTQSSATTTAQKVGGSLTRQAIEEAAPGVIKLNAREAKLIDAAKAINRAVGREANQYKLHGGKALVGAAVGTEELARTGSPFLAALKGLATTTVLQPSVMSRAAIVASRLGRMSGIPPAMAVRIAVAAVQSEMESSGEPTEAPSAPTVVHVGPYRVEPQ